MPNRILIDLGPLRESRGFRLLFAGELVEVLLPGFRRHDRRHQISGREPERRG